jgi:hypothetical protein
VDILEEWVRIGVDLAASLMTAADTRSGKVQKEQPKLARGLLQQTCVVDARQHTIASGSCCCNSLGESRSCPDFRTESSGATAHSKTDRHGSEKVRSALGRVS